MHPVTQDNRSVPSIGSPVMRTVKGQRSQVGSAIAHLALTRLRDDRGPRRSARGDITTDPNQTCTRGQVYHSIVSREIVAFRLSVTRSRKKNRGDQKQ